MRVIRHRLVKVAVWVAGILLGMLLLVQVALFLPPVQRWLKRQAVGMMEAYLGTRLDVGHVGLSILQREVMLRDLHLDDPRGERLLDLEGLEVSLSSIQPWKGRYVIGSVHCQGLHLGVYQLRRDSVTNYQFLIDAFRSGRKDTVSASGKKPSKGVDFSVRELSFSDVALVWSRPWKMETDTLLVSRLQFLQQADSSYLGILDSLQLMTDNHRPRTNTGKPHRGAFDVGHLNLTVRGRLGVRPIGRDSFHLDVLHLEACDRGAGLLVDSIRLHATGSVRQMRVRDFYLRSQSTVIEVPEVALTLPSRKEGRGFGFEAPKLTATVVLQNLSQPFAPALGRFSTPLCMSVSAEGDTADIRCRDICITSPDGRFTLTADGLLHQLGRKHEMCLTFDVHRMVAKGGFKEQIVGHFNTQKSMNGLLQKAGDITYRNGKVKIVYKREYFSGNLKTKVGWLAFRFNIDGRSHYLHGWAQSDSVHLGSIVEGRNLGRLAFEARFDFDITGKRAAQRLGRPHGKLPIGDLSGEVTHLQYRRHTYHNFLFLITSNGHQACGEVDKLGRMLDVGCTFTFDDTEFGKSLHVKPRLRMAKRR